MRNLEIANTVHETLKYTVNVNEKYLQLKTHLSALQTDPGIVILPDPRNIPMEEFCPKTQCGNSERHYEKLQNRP